MSLINRMLKDLEAQPVKGDVAPIYRPPSRRLPGWYWWILLLLPLSLWLWWQPLQQRLHPAAKPVAEPSVVAAPAKVGSTSPKIADTAVMTPQTMVLAAPMVASSQNAKQPQASEPSQAIPRNVTSDVVSENKTISTPVVSQNSPKKNSELATHSSESHVTTAESKQIAPIDDADATAEPEPLGEMYVEEQTLSAGEIAALERRKYQQAIARRDNVGAQQALLQVLANDPLDLSSRKQLAALYYGENQLNAAREVLQQGITLMPNNADLRLLNARVAQAMGDKQAALQSLQAITPSASNNLDFYAMRAALAQQLGQAAEAGYSYQALTKAQPMVGRWWLGLAISKEQRGLMADAKQAYRRALLDNQLSAASRRFAQQRIQHLEP